MGYAYHIFDLRHFYRDSSFWDLIAPCAIDSPHKESLWKCLIKYIWNLEVYTGLFGQETDLELSTIGHSPIGQIQKCWQQTDPYLGSPSGPRLSDIHFRFCLKTAIL